MLSSPASRGGSNSTAAQARDTTAVLTAASAGLIWKQGEKLREEKEGTHERVASPVLVVSYGRSRELAGSGGKAWVLASGNVCTYHASIGWGLISHLDFARENVVPVATARFDHVPRIFLEKDASCYTSVPPSQQELGGGSALPCTAPTLTTKHRKVRIQRESEINKVDHISHRGHTFATHEPLAPGASARTSSVELLFRAMRPDRIK